ncbi:tripartite motif containing 105 [Festucalex cinctus]
MNHLTLTSLPCCVLFFLTTNDSQVVWLALCGALDFSSAASSCSVWCRNRSLEKVFLHHGCSATPSVPQPSKGNIREKLTRAICCDLFQELVWISRYWRATRRPVTWPQCLPEFMYQYYDTSTMVEKSV